MTTELKEDIEKIVLNVLYKVLEKTNLSRHEIINDEDTDCIYVLRKRDLMNTIRELQK